ALGQFREFGEKWGTAIALAQLAEFTELRADHAASIAALEEAASIGNELGAWGDMCYVDAMLAVIRARTGDVARGRADLDRAVRTAEEVGNKGDIRRGGAGLRGAGGGRGGRGFGRGGPGAFRGGGQGRGARGGRGGFAGAPGEGGARPGGRRGRGPPPLPGAALRGAARRCRVGRPRGA